MFYETILESLQKFQVKYLVVGGIAVNLHGVPRPTADLDLMVELSPENLSRFIQAMKDAGYAPRLPVEPEELLSPEKRREWIDERNLKAFTFWNKKTTFEQVDMLLEASANQSAYDKGKRIQIGEIEIIIASKEDLIAMKELAGRKQDLSDIEALKEILRFEREGE